jgi:tetratricopeptide (TPR) repeat protein
MTALMNRLGNDHANWTLLDVSGSVLIFGWNEGRQAGGFARLAFDAERLAFGEQDEKAHRELPTAPEQGPALLPDRRTWDQQLMRLPAHPSWESAAATTYLKYFHQRHLHNCLSSLAAGLEGLPAPHSAAALVPRILLTERSSELPLLAVRAARRAVAVNPEDSNAWLRLGQAYLLLYRVTCEHSVEGMLPLLARLRQIQSITALQQALRLNPDLEEAHHGLTDLYSERDYLDMALDHREEELRIGERAGQRVGESAEEHALRLELLTRDIARREKLVHERRDKYATGTRALVGEPVQKARLALNLGLAREAMDEILSTPGERLGVIGIKVELELLLELGRTEEARARLNEKQLIAFKHNLGFEDISSPVNAAGTALYPVPYRLPLYDWLRVLQTASVGDYARAQESLRTIHGGLGAAHDMTMKRVKALRNRDDVMIGSMFSGPLIYLPAAIAGMIDKDVHERTDLQNGEGVVRAQQADLLVLVGMLALEQGSTDKARSAFSTAQKLCEQPSGATVPFAGESIVNCYLGKLRGQE